MALLCTPGGLINRTELDVEAKAKDSVSGDHRECVGHSQRGAAGRAGSPRRAPIPLSCRAAGLPSDLAAVSLLPCLCCHQVARSHAT